MLDTIVTYFQGFCLCSNYAAIPFVDLVNIHHVAIGIHHLCEDQDDNV